MSTSKKYREKLKKDPERYEEYLKKERMRYEKKVLEGKIKTIKTARNEKEKQNLREKWKEKMRKYRQKKKNNQDQNIQGKQKCGKPDGRVEAGKIRRRNFIAGLKERVKEIETRLKKANKKIKSLRKQVSRLKEKTLTTPEKEVKRLLKNKKVTPGLKKELLFAKVMSKQIESSYKNEKNQKKKRDFAKKLSGTVVKRHKFFTLIQKLTSRRAITHKNSIKRKKAQEKKRKMVESFLEDDENSRQTPGKKDTITKNKIKKQKRLLNDDMKNLYRKFKKENPGVKLSYSLFCKLKPFWVIKHRTENRDTCLCIKHENFALMVQKLKSANMIKESSTEEIIKSMTCEDYGEECLERKCLKCCQKEISFLNFEENEEIEYKKWVSKKIQVTIKGQEKSCQKMIKQNIKIKKVDLATEFKGSVVKFFQHVSNLKHQFKTLKTIKNELKEDEMLIYMDFSENYTCKYATEVQSAHFGGSKPQLSLHTIVAYVRVESELKSYSFCSVSENLRHDPAAIAAHLIPVAKTLLKICPNPKIVHFTSDGPATQYRNKKMFFLTAKYLSNLLNVREAINWHYQEAGHGKGPHDGVGGTIKRTADKAVALGTDVSNVSSFINSVSNLNVQVMKIDVEKIEEIDQIIPENLKAFSGTMAIHNFVWRRDKENILFMRRLSCLVCQNECVHYSNGTFIISSPPPPSPPPSPPQKHSKKKRKNETAEKEEPKRKSLRISERKKKSEN